MFPNLQIVDFRTHISGVDASVLARANASTLAEAQVGGWRCALGQRSSLCAVFILRQWYSYYTVAFVFIYYVIDVFSTGALYVI